MFSDAKQSVLCLSMKCSNKLQFISVFDKVKNVQSIKTYLIIIYTDSFASRMEDDMSEEYLEEGEDLFVTLDLDDGTTVECQVLTIFEVEEEEQDYVVLLPLDDNEEGEVFIYRYFEDEDGEPGLDNIESEEEFEMVSEIFDQLVEDGEYDEILED